MKKRDKIEIVLFIATILLAGAAAFFYSQSQQVVMTTEIPYSETGTTNYKVYLSDNTYYDKEYLDEGMQYISSIINYVDVNFKYNAIYENIKEYEVNKNVVATITITDSDDNNNIIYTKTDTLKDEKNNLKDLNIDENIKIDYIKYNSLVNEIKTKYGISAECTLKVDYNLVYSSKKDGLSAVKKLSVSMPLSKQLINIKKGEYINDSGIYTGQAVNSTLNGIMTLCMIIMLLLASSTLAALVLRIRDRIKKESKYDRFIKKVLKEYDSYITEAAEDNYIPKKEIIKINSFKELLDVRNNIDKTIIYTKLDDDTSRFQIIDEEIYEFIVTREEMDD